MAVSVVADEVVAEVAADETCNTNGTEISFQIDASLILLCANHVYSG